MASSPDMRTAHGDWVYMGDCGMTEEEQAKARHSLFEIALVKSYAYTEEYNPTSGRTEPREGALYLKEGYIDGFLAGFAHRMGGGK